MYYELYLDHIFFMDFLVNFTLLFMVNNERQRIASGKRLMLTALMVAIINVIAICIMPKLWLGEVAGALLGLVVMPKIGFRARNLNDYIYLTGKLLKWTFVLGGSMLFLIRLSDYCVWGINTGVLIGIICGGCLLFSCLAYREKGEDIYDVILLNKGKKIKVQGIIDTGNLLRDAIGGSWVSVMGKECADGIELCNQRTFRPVFYKSVDCQKGMLESFEIEEMRILIKGGERVIKNPRFALCDNEQVKDFIIINYNQIK